MNRTYELTDEIKCFDGHFLHRIVANDNNIHVGNGKVGGWIEGVENLQDDAWVADEAMVYGNAAVCGKAMVSGNSIVKDSANVCSNAIVCDNAVICGNAFISGNAMVMQLARVSGIAKVRKSAMVCGKATVCGHATITGHANVSDDALVDDYAKVGGYATVRANAHVHDHVKIGGRAKIGGKCVLMGNAVLHQSYDHKSFSYDDTNVKGDEGFKITLTFTNSNRMWNSSSFYGNSASLLDYALKVSDNFYQYCFNIICALMSENPEWDLIPVKSVECRVKSEMENN